MTLKSYLKSCGLGSQIFIAVSQNGRALYVTEDGADILAYTPAKYVPEVIDQEWVNQVKQWPVKPDSNGHMCALPGQDLRSFDLD